MWILTRAALVLLTNRREAVTVSCAAPKCLASSFGVWRLASVPFVLLITLVPTQAQHSAGPFAPLWLYTGTWQVSPSNKAAGSKPDTLVNQCAELGKAFACGQIVNSQAGGLVVFLPKGEAGHFVTQTIMPDGRASGLVALEVNGNTWTYNSRRDEYGKTTYFRTLNVFTGKTRIHYEQAHSADQKQWTVDSSGDEVRIATGQAPR
jgi:hypothetical protein